MRKAIIAVMAAMALGIVVSLLAPFAAAAQEPARTIAPIQDKGFVNFYGPVLGGMVIGMIAGYIFGSAVARAATAGAQKKSTQTAPPAAQEAGYLNSYIALLKTDVNTRKIAIITESLSLNAKDLEAFSAVYKRYERDSARFKDDRRKLIKDYVNNYEQMSETKAGALTERTFALEEQRVGLKREYLKQFEDVLPGRKVARFFQLEYRINLLADLQIASEIPIIE
jgi:hypothetical protein